jgi:hypothetical protein
MTEQVEPFADDPRGGPPVRGVLHRTSAPSGDALVLAHGAGSNRDAPTLVAVARALAAAGFLVLRCDLPYRQARPEGPPFPAAAARDREGLRAAALALRRLAPGRVFMGGHSYGGRQASVLLAEAPSVAAGLLLLSYPLHPPRRPAELRTAHFPTLRVPALFVHGSRDPFGSLEEIEAARLLIPAPTAVMAVDRAGHDLRPLCRPDAARAVSEDMAELVAAFRVLVG